MFDDESNRIRWAWSVSVDTAHARYASGKSGGEGGGEGSGEGGGKGRGKGRGKAGGETRKDGKGAVDQRRLSVSAPGDELVGTIPGVPGEVRL